MTDSPPRTSSALPLLAILAIAVAVVAAGGCDERLERVRAYTVPKEAAPPLPQVAAAAMAADAPDLRWTLPEGWRSAPNPNAMRFATLLAGDGDRVMETSVTRLGGTAGGVAANVNRWRGQVGLPPADDATLAAIVRPVAAAGARGVMVDLAAPGDDPSSPRMLAAIFPSRAETWFVKAIGPRDVLETHRAGFDDLCGSVTFDAPPAAAEAPPPGGPSWPALPEGWTLDATPQAMSVASVTVTGTGQEASLTITPLGGPQDLLANINRWRRQVGLAPAADLAEAVAGEIEVDGAAGTLVDAAGDGGHTIGVITRRGSETWFFKLSGPDPLVAGQRAAFEAFIRSLRFDRQRP